MFWRYCGRASVQMLKMSELLLRPEFFRRPAFASGSVTPLRPFGIRYSLSTLTYVNALDGGRNKKNSNGSKWFRLPPFVLNTDASTLGRKLSLRHTEQSSNSSPSKPTTTTALKWIRQCCPQLPYSLVHKLFRLRQVRGGPSDASSSDEAGQDGLFCLRRIAAKDAMKPGDQIFLPISVQNPPSSKQQLTCSDEGIKFIRSLELYKDPDIIVINKPPGMAVQGGSGIKWSLDELAATCLRYDYPEPPRLVHRIDRDSSGILVMGRTQESATILHSIFRDKTFGASEDGHDNRRRILQKYWALVIGCPRRSSGLISAPLGKVVMDGGKSDRIMLIENSQEAPSQHAITEYRIIGSSDKGYTWLELCPLTGRKHQLRVHCAEVLGTPIVGDFKYGRNAHKKLKDLFHDPKIPNQMTGTGGMFGFVLDSENQPALHLHCRQMVLPNISKALEKLRLSSDSDLSNAQPLTVSAPLPPHMQRSWEILLDKCAD